ncbi:glycosyltransferase family 4 protein [Pontiellaceae bacterium B12227]|nr:glycosyltransferase family 4 protein [Pontiellaceae bacterium B12227]
MKIIQVHNYYQQAGGEDAVVEAERALLEVKGNIVVPYYKDNEALGSGFWALGKASLQTLWNWETYREFRRLLQAEKPDVVHCHNTFPLISPSIYWACAKEKVPVVQTLHNYRLLCLNAFLFRKGDAISHQPSAIGQEKETEQQRMEAKSCELKAKGSICELCLTKSFKYPGIKYRCYRQSLAGSLVIAIMLFVHKLIGTWSKKVTAYIALTEFQKQKMIEGGLPEDKVWVKPNFIQQSAIGNQQSGDVGLLSDLRSLSSEYTPFALFVGRLSPEKGCDVLIQAWSQFTSNFNLQASNLETAPQLLIVGDGPEREALEVLTKSYQLSAVSFLGKKPKNEVLQLMQKAQLLVFTSIWYETFGLTVLEAGLCETPSLVSAPTTTSGLIVNMTSGLLYATGDSEEMAEKIEWAFEHPDEMQAMGVAARRDFEDNYSADVNYTILNQIYTVAQRGEG